MKSKIGDRIKWNGTIANTFIAEIIGITGYATVNIKKNIRGEYNENTHYCFGLPEYTRCHQWQRLIGQEVE